MSLLEARNLRKSYGERLVVDNVDLTVAAGEALGLLGPNGAGKSTTMMMLAGLIAPDGGTITIEGRTLGSDPRQYKHCLGLVPQDLAIYPDLSARENLEFFGRLYGLRGAALRQRVDEVLGLVGLSDRAGSDAQTFSGGMKRRLNFGVALLHRPRVLILDEPTVGVDPQSRSYLLQCVRDVAAQGVAVLYASHYMEEVEAICDRVAILDHGKMLACGSVQKLLDGMEADVRLHVSSAPSVREQLEGLVRIEQNGDGETALVVRSGGQAMNVPLVRVLQALNDAEVELYRIETNEANLERLFLELTGHRLRD